MKRVLITGARGLLGSACLREFRQDHEVCTPNISPEETVDLRNREAVRKMFNELTPDIVIHCAARVGGVKANKEKPVEFMLDNLTMQNNVIEAAHDGGVRRLCFVATSCMYPRDTALPVSEESLLQGPLESSVEAYAIAKLAGWRLCKAYWEQHGDRFITVAPSNVYGIGDNYSEEAHVIPALMRRYHEAVQSGEPLRVWGDGSAVREFVFADDVANAIRIALSFWKSPELINIGTGIGTSIRELVNLLIRTAPYATVPEIIWDDSMPTGIPQKTFNVEKIRKLSWEPKYSLEEGLIKTWRDFSSGRRRGM